MKTKVKYINIFFSLYFFMYISGLALPFIYSLLRYFEKGFIALVRRHVLLLFLFGLYLTSLLLSVRFDFFTTERFLASLHNIVVAAFIPVGYYIGQNREASGKSIKIFFVFVILVLIPYIGFSFYREMNWSYHGLLSFLSENKYTKVVFSVPYFIGNFKFSRIHFLAPYATASAFYLIALNTYRSVVKKTLKVDYIDFFLLVITVFTAARFLLIIIIVQLLLKVLTRSYAIKQLVIILFPIIILVGIDIAFLILESRQGSNNTRLRIYEESFKMMLKESPFIGIGIKPRMPDILGIYPMGSHSTLNTIFYKTGILGGLVFLYIYLKTFLKRIKKIFNGWLSKDRELIYISVSQLLFLIAILFEDLDADEFYAFCFGLVLGMRKK